MSEIDRPLYMPKGSVRSIIAIAFTGTACYGFINGTVSAEVFVPLVTMVGAYYFASRKNKEDNNNA